MASTAMIAAAATGGAAQSPATGSEMLATCQTTNEGNGVLMVNNYNGTS